MSGNGTKRKGEQHTMSAIPDKPSENKDHDQPLKYPKSVFFIIGNEFCERFSYYGMRTILSLYLTQALHYSERTATIIYHTFVMLCYFTPLFGGIMADSWLGKYKTILYVSLFYSFGNIVLAVSSISDLSIPHATLSLLGLFLIATGTGGIKPCVSSFGGDQFVVPQQQLQLESFFSVFYFSINAGSLISTFITPIIRENVHCFGRDNCYPVAFGIPAVLMCLAVVIFVCGKPLYKIKKPSGNIALDVANCVGHAVVRKVQTMKHDKKDHWLDYAAPKYSKQLIEDTKVLFKLIILFSPTVLFWTLFEQQGSKWTFQATNMDGNVNGWFTIQPDQMQSINPILCLLFIPLFQSIVYPLLHKLHLVRTPLQKLTWGGLLAALAFLVSGLLQLRIEKDKAIIPGPGQAQLRFYNTFNCPIHLLSPNETINGTLLPLDTIQFLDLPVEDKQIIEINATLDKSCSKSSSPLIANVEISNKEISSYLFTKPLSIQILNLTGTDEVKKSKEGHAKFKIIYGKKESLRVTLKGPADIEISVNNYQSPLVHLKDRGEYSIFVNGEQLNSTINILPGGYYTFLITESDKQMTGKLFVVTKPNLVNLLWQIPQYIIITAAEIMFSITGLEFSFTQSPVSMKSVISSIWLLTDSFGNVIVLFVESLHMFDSAAYEFFLFAGMMAAVMLVFIVLAMNYKYTNVESDAKKETDVLDS